MLSAACLEARRRGEPLFPVLAVDLAARGLDLGRIIISTAFRSTALGQVTHGSVIGGWEPIDYGSGVAESALEAVTTSVRVVDPDGSLAQTLDVYDPRGSTSRMDWAAPGLPDSDWTPLLRGVLEDWEINGLEVTLHLKTDDALLRKPIPPDLYLRGVWGSAEDASIFSANHSLVVGIHDLFDVHARGAVPLVNIRYDKDLGYWYALSSSRMVEVTRLYFDGIVQGAGGWSVLRGVYGSSYLTIVSIAEGYQPAKDVIVSVDCKGPDETGGFGGDTLTGVPDQLRAVLEEWAFREPPLGDWRGAHARIDATSWDAGSAYFALHLFESAVRLGGEQDSPSAAELVQEFLDAYPWVRIQWTPAGTLQFIVIDPDDVDPDDAAHLHLDLHHDGGLVPFERGDAREVYTHVRQPYMFSAADQKYMSAYEAHDIAAVPGERIVLSIDNPWSQCRLTQEGAALNPAAPADPTP